MGAKDKYEFILILNNETELGLDESVELINRIPFNYLGMAKNKYKNDGLLSLMMFAKAVNYIV